MRSIVLLLAVCFLTACSTQPDTYGTEPVVVEPSDEPAATQTDTITEDTMASTNRHAVIVTNKGTIEIELHEDKAPLTTGNFISLAEKGYYNNVTFHRVIPGFMIQGGDPTGTGRGGPGYTIKDEFGPGLRHDKAGVLSMANAGPGTNTGGSQFFITVAPAKHLDGAHAIFGQVVKGQDVVNTIVSVPRDRNDKPLEPVVMQSVTIK